MEREIEEVTMGYSLETANKLLTAIEVLSTSSGSMESRAFKASQCLIGIKAEEFEDGPRTFWSYIEENSKSVREQTATESVVTKYVSSIWQLFEACRPKH
ncbi:hypothetical protein [Pseudomonas costantinii]|uniref:hypothetical protein n=1 Tax=Pseudomonas costantinii TaxID=168469 RepID=UPI0015A4303F|nr:hypothetical protein [Pseudomonas costantinii]NVZ70539.1 hypothetical protein [Pseudomonas costantinii]